jgi:Thrombospondin type 1 domain
MMVVSSAFPALPVNRSHILHCGLGSVFGARCGLACRVHSLTAAYRSRQTGRVHMQACNAQPCLTYKFVTGRWGLCSSACGDGVQARTVACASTGGATVADARCTGLGLAKPAAERLCNVNSCDESVAVWAVTLRGPSVPALCGGSRTQESVCQCAFFCARLSILVSHHAPACRRIWLPRATKRRKCRAPTAYTRRLHRVKRTV